MKLYIIILIGLAALILFILLCLAAVSVWIRKSRFGHRSEGNPFLKYFTAGDFENLKAEPISFASDKGQTLRGYIYSDQTHVDYKGVAIWAHGIGAGHNAYTTEICYLARQGYLVLGYDNTGCVMSDGKELGGLVQGAIDASFAVRFAGSDERLKNYKRVLVGHSWGAYSAMNIFSFGESVDGVVAMCGFRNADNIIADMSRRYFGYFSCLIKLFTALIHRLRFGKYASLSSEKSLRKSKVPVLLLYGEDDKVVPFRYNGQKLIKSIADKENIESIVYSGKGHSVYLTREAESYMKSIFAEISSLKEKTVQEREKFLNSIDYSLMTKEDDSVMNKIKEFMDSVFCS